MGLIPLNAVTEAEIKRLFVDEAYRARGIAKALLLHLEQWAVGQGVRNLYLESGSREHAARGLYLSLGYEVCGTFADYAEDPHSVFLSKVLAPSER